MEQIVEKITQDLLQKISDEIQSITPDELLSAGVPYVVVETIRKNIESTIDSELNLSESKWVQISNEPVQRAWQNFIRVSKEHLNIPKDKLSYLLTEAVEQCLELAVKPRQSVPEIIFRTRETIDLQSVKERVDSIQVNKQLGLALLRYMQKKEVEEISFDQAHHLIKKVDERLIEDYHPLKWAQALKPVFDLAGPAVDAELFRIYFEDKEKPAYARKFDQMDEPLNESEFIEALSSADVLDVEDYDTLQSELPIPADKETEPEKVVEIDETDEEEKVVNNDDEVVLEEPAEERDHNEIVVEDKDSDSEDVEDQEEENIFEKEQPEEFEEPEYEQQESFEVEDSEDELSDEEEEDQKENIVDLFSKIREVDHIESDNDSKPVISLVEDEDDDEDEEAEDNITLLSKFMFDESDEGNPDSEVVEEESESEEKIPAKEPTSIYDEMNLVQDDRANRQKNNSFDYSDDEAGEDEEELSFKIESSDEEEDESEEAYQEDKKVDYDLEEDEDDGDDQPMWRSFLERDDLETESGYEYDEEGEHVEVGEFEEDEDDGFIEEPIYDLRSNEADHDEKIKKISVYLDDDKDRFIDKIFKGSEFAYEQALTDILDFENWKAASMYLESEVFSRNKIDIYDEVAVDFTDRLHSYFLENNTNHED